MQIIGSVKQEWRYLLALAVLCAGMLFYGLGRLPLIGPDEPRYAEVAREMYLSGDWITPRLGGILWFEKPALLYWMVAAGYRCLGVSEWSARLGVALTASLGAALLFFFGRRVRSARFGYLSAATLVTSGMWVGFGRAATFDIPLAVTMELALLAFFVWEGGQASSNGGGAKRGAGNSGWWVCCFALGLAVLAKGLIGVLLPLGVMGPYLIATGGLGRMLKRPGLLAVGALIFVVTAGTWYGPMIARHGREFIQEFFVAHHFQRFLTNKYHHPQPSYFFFAIALMGSFPWSCYLVAEAWQAVRGWRRVVLEPAERLRLFLWLWVIIPIIFFSLSSSKLPGYILPIFPAVALMIGRELEGWWSEAGLIRLRRLGALTATLVFIAALGVGWRGSRELGVSVRASWVAAAVAMAVVLVYLGLLWRRSGRGAALFLPFGLIAVVIVAAHWLLPGLGVRESMRELSQVAAQAARPGERLAFYINSEQSIHFYAPDLPLRDPHAELVTAMSPAEVAALIEVQTAPSLLVISRERWSADLIYDKLMDAEKLGAQRDLVLLRVSLRE